MRRWMAVLCSCLMFLSACGSGPDEPKDVGPDGPGADTLMGLVATLPALDEPTFTISFGDVEALAEANDVEVAAGGDVDALLEWAMAAVPSGVPVLLPQRLQPERLAFHDEFADELGVSLWSAQRYAGLDSPPYSVAVVEGDGVVDAAEDALGEPDDDGVWRIGERELDLDLTATSAARPLGEALRLAAAGDDRVAMATTEALLDGVLGATKSLMDDEAVAAVVVALDDSDVVSGLIARTEGDDGTLVGGVAFSREGDDVTARLVFAGADREVVEEFFDGTTSTGQPWSDLLMVEAVEDGQGVVTIEVSFGQDQTPQTVVNLLQRGPFDWPI